MGKCCNDLLRPPPIADISSPPLASDVKRAFLICIGSLTSCTSQPDAGCPAIEKLAHMDAATDARAALARGDRHLLMLGGFVGSVPGVANPGSHPTQMMEGTSDTKTKACAHQGATAEAYAVKYNRIIVQATGG